MKPYNCPHCGKPIDFLPHWYLECYGCGWSGTITYYNNLMKEKNKTKANQDKETCRAEQPR